MRRRQVIAAGVVTALGGLAGCAGLGGGGSGASDDGTPAPPASDASPRELLPEAPDGWEQDGTRVVGDGAGAEAGLLGYYTPDGSAGYRIGVYRFGSESRAEELATGIGERGEFYDFQFAVRRGNFIFAGDHQDGTESDVVMLLGRSPALTESIVRENDLL